MSKRRTRASDIKNPENYFNRYIALEVRKGIKKEQMYYEVSESLEKMFSGGGGAKAKNQLLLAVNLNDEEYENYIVGSNFFGWIDMIENEDLLTAISQLSEKDKVFLTLRYQYCLSQLEIAKIIGVSQVATCRRESRIMKKLKKFFERGYKNR